MEQNKFDKHDINNLSEDILIILKTKANDEIIPKEKEKLEEEIQQKIKEELEKLNYKSIVIDAIIELEEGLKRKDINFRPQYIGRKETIIGSFTPEDSIKRNVTLNVYTENNISDTKLIQLFRKVIEPKVKAILSTLTLSSYEEIVKIVVGKIDLNDIFENRNKYLS